MLPAFRGCRDRDLPGPEQHFQTSSSTTFPCHRRGRRQPRMHLCYGQVSSEGFQHQKTTGFASRITHLKTGPEPPFPAGTREAAARASHRHSADGARATPAPWAQELSRLRGTVAATAQLQRLCSRSTTVSCAQALPVPQLVFSLKNRTFIWEGKRKPSKFVLLPGRTI